jgi:hypothetical protein
LPKRIIKHCIFNSAIRWLVSVFTLKWVLDLNSKTEISIHNTLWMRVLKKWVCMSYIALGKPHIFIGHNSACLHAWLFFFSASMNIVVQCLHTHFSSTSNSCTGNWMLFHFGTYKELWGVWLVWQLSVSEHCACHQVLQYHHTLVLV